MFPNDGGSTSDSAFMTIDNMFRTVSGVHQEQEVGEGEARDTTVEGSQGGKGHDGVSGGGVADGGGGSAEGRDTDGGGGGGRLSVASGVSRKETATAATANTESRLSDRDRDRDRGQDRVDPIDGKVVSGEQAQELLRL